MPDRPRLLDLFCCEGGAGMGYHRAGFEVVGVDIVAQPRYPFEFHQADALTFPLDGFDAVHASPPCQAYSISRNAHSKQHPQLIEPIRHRLKSAGIPYVIENVPGAPLHGPVILCGTMFGLGAVDEDGSVLFLRRHRLFETTFLVLTTPCRCLDELDSGKRVGGVYGGGSANFEHARNVRHGGYTPGKKQRAELIDAPWMTLRGLSQAIPPAYTEFIGDALMRAILERAA